MEKLTLTIVEERNIFKEALYYLNYLKLEDVVHNEELKDYINQMLYNEKEEDIDEDNGTVFTIVDIDFRDKLHAQIACAFWNAVCAETREHEKFLYEVAFNMYYGLVMALENADIKEEGGAL